MKFVTYGYQGEVKVGVLAGDAVIPVSAAGLAYESMNDLVRGLTEEEKASLEALIRDGSEEAVPFAETVKMAPIPRPRQDVVCLGINYASHAEEAARFHEEAFGLQRPVAIYFAKRVNEAVPDGGEIDSHPGLVEKLDYESELGVVLRKDCKNVKPEEVLDKIFGYTVINDVSARTVQTLHKQWYFGKSLDTFTPMGPCIATADEFDWPPKLAIRSYVNGEIRQNSNTGLLINDISHVICELSAGMTLEAGTIIATGTPAGVGMGMIPPCFLKPGDVVCCEIEGIGSITNKVR